MSRLRRYLINSHVHDRAKVIKTTSTSLGTSCIKPSLYERALGAIQSYIFNQTLTTPECHVPIHELQRPADGSLCAAYGNGVDTVGMRCDLTCVGPEN